MMPCPKCRKAPEMVGGGLFGCAKCGHYVSVTVFWNEYVQRVIRDLPEMLRGPRESKAEKLIFDAMMEVSPNE